MKRLDDPHQIMPERLKHAYNEAVLYMPAIAANDSKPVIIKLRYKRPGLMKDYHIFELVHQPQNEISLCIMPSGLVYLASVDCETRLFDNYWFAYGWALRSMRKSRWVRES